MILENLPNGGVSVIDKKLNIIFAQGVIFEKLKKENISYTGMKIQKVFPKDESTKIKSLVMKAFKGSSQKAEFSIDGFTFLNSIIPVIDGNKKITHCLIISLDVTEQKRFEQMLRIEKRKLEKESADKRKVEESLRKLSKLFVKAQEQERLKISRDLHDEVNQILSIAKLKMHLLDENLNTWNDKEVKKQVKNIINHLEKSISVIRNIAKNLRPSAIEEFGIVSSLYSLCEEFNSRTGIQTNCVFPEKIERFSDDIEIAIYRIVQESLFNIEKHAKAKKARVIIENIDKYLKIRISDNGIGFNVKKYKEIKEDIKGLGLIGMRERAESVGGKFYFRSLPPKGTIIIVFIPIVKRKSYDKK